jgi:SAM-dependent methyltransferase
MKVNPLTQNAASSILESCTCNVDWYKGYIYGNSPRIEGDFNFIKGNVLPSEKILDIGAIPPLLVEMLRQDGFINCSIADPNPDAFSDYFQKHGVGYQKIDLINQSFKEFENKFDLVCLNEVVEHISGNLLSAIQNAVDCVRPGGKILITTPNLRSIWGLYALVFRSSGLASKPGALVREQYERASAKYGYYGHLREFTKNEIIHLLESFNLKLYKVELQSNYLNFGKHTKQINFLESLFPKWRLFAKYLFIKNT